jgi:hypothetical protein
MPLTVLDYNSQYFPLQKSKPHPSFYPIITNVQANSLTGVITWTTDVVSTSQVFYGLVPYLGFVTNRDSTYVTSHSVQLSGLTAGLLYYFKVQSFNQDCFSLSDLYTFVYNPVSGDIALEDGTGIILAEDGTKIATES